MNRPNTPGAGHESLPESLSAFWETFHAKENPTDRYERFYYCKRYVQAKSAAFPGNEGHRQLGSVLGYNVWKGSFLNKFGERRRAWDAFACDIPRAYLEAIGVLERELDTCLDADLELFAQERKKTRYPRVATVRYMHAVYGTYRFPEGTAEEDAIAMLRNSKYARYRCALNYPELLVVRIEPEDSEPVYDSFEPRYEWRKKHLRLRPLACGVGVTRV